MDGKNCFEVIKEAVGGDLYQQLKCEESRDKKIIQFKSRRTENFKLLIQDDFKWLLKKEEFSLFDLNNKLHKATKQLHLNAN
jgi:hypothetical protein